MKFLRALFLAAVFPLTQAYSNPGSCSGACWAHDPSVVKRSSDGLYFKFNTGGFIEIATSSSWGGPWTLQGYVLTKDSIISNSGNSDLWAPDVHLVNGVYHLYYAVSVFGSQVSAIGLATSSTMMPGTWTDLGSTGISSVAGSAYNAIDPNLILVGSTYYMNFGSFWGDIYQVKMNTAATLSSGTAYNIEYYATGTRPCEGSFMFYNIGYYYLLWSQGICCGYDTSMPATGAEYKIQMCRSTSATSGFVDKNGVACTSSGGSTLLASHGTVYGPGGQGILYDSSVGWVLYYHYADTTVGYADSEYKFGWNVLTWSASWPVV